MLLRDLHICSEFRTGAEETTEILTLLAAIRERDSGAIAGLSRKSDWLRTYCIPVMVQFIMSCLDADEPHSRHGIEEAGNFLRGIFQSPGRTVQSSVSSIMNALLEGVFADPSSRLESIEAYRPDGSDSPAGELKGYGDIDAFPVETFLLSIFDELSSHEDGRERVAGSVERMGWIRDAADGVYGRYNRELAFSILANTGTRWMDMRRKFPTEWAEYPALQNIAIRYLLKNADTREKKIELLLEESKSLDGLIRNDHSFHDGELWLERGRRSDINKDRLFLVDEMWRIALWNQIYETAPEAAGENLLPIFVSYEEAARSRYRDGQFEYSAGNSPWLTRGSEIYNIAPEVNNHYYFQNSNIALRAFGAMDVLRRICLQHKKAKKDVPDAGILFLINVKDAMTGGEYLKEVKTHYAATFGEENLWSRPIRALGCYVRELIKAIGMGSAGMGGILPNLPERVYGIFNRLSPLLKPDAALSRQERYLLETVGFMVCANWFSDALSFSHPDGTDDNEWFDGDRESYAAQICKWIFEKAWKELKRPYIACRDVASVCYQKFPEIMQAKLRDFPRKGNIKTAKLLLSKEMDARQWKEIAIVSDKNNGSVAETNPSARVFMGDSYYIALTKKLISFIRVRDRSVEPQETREIIEEWKRYFFSLGSERDFSRIARHIVAELFSISEYDTALNNDLVVVLILAIESIVEYSTGSPFYQYELMNKLRNESHFGDETGNRLRALFLCYLVEINDEADEEGNPGRVGPLIRHFLHTFADDIRKGGLELARNGLLAYWRRASNDTSKNTVTIAADKITWKSGGSASETVDDEAALREWSPDTLEFLECYRNSEKKELQEDDVAIEASNGQFRPAQRDFVRFVVEVLLDRENADGAADITYIRDLGGLENRLRLFSAGKCRNYVIADTDWDPAAAKKLAEKIAECGEENACGLKFRVALSEDANGRALAITIKEINDSVVRWAGLRFDDENVVQTKREGKQWTVSLPSADSGDLPAIHADFDDVTKGGERKTAQATVEPDGWSLVQQRKGELKLKTFTVTEHKMDPAVSPEELKRLIRLSCGDVLTLKSISRKGRNGYFIAWTTHNMPVKVAEESLTWLSTARLVPTGKVANRRCIVENIYYAPNDQSLPRLFDGIVWALTEGAPDETQSECTIDVRLESGEIRSAPPENFSPRPQKIGDPVVMTTDGFFTVYSREICVRALWEVADRMQSAEQPENATFLKTEDINRFGSCDVWEDSTRPVLYACPARATTDRPIPNPGRGTPRSLAKRFCHTGKFPHARGMWCVAFVNENRERFVCDVQGAFPPGGMSIIPGRCTAFALGLFPMGTDGAYYDLRRVLTVEQTVPHRAETRDDDGLKEDRERFNDWLRKGDGHALGELHGGCLKLFHLSVPRIAGNDDEYTQSVAVADGGLVPLVPGRGYSTRTVRAKLEVSGNSWVARTPDPMPLASAAEYLVGKGHPRPDESWPIRVKLYYAGTDDYGNLQFEWGTGFVMKAIPGDVQWENGKIMCLVFGDRIDNSRLSYATNANGGWILRLDSNEVFVDTPEHRLYDDSIKRGVVQNFRVRVLSGNKLEILHASLSTDAVHRDSLESIDSWEQREVPNALFDENDAAEITLGKAVGAEFDILGRIADDSRNDSRGRRMLRYTRISRKDLRDGEVLCMEAGEITKPDERSIKIKNEYWVEFSFPAVEAAEEEPFRVDVRRRLFSYNEGLLRVRGKNAFKNQRMLVKLEPKDSERNPGSVIRAFTRNISSLKDYIRIKQRVFADSGGCLNGTLRVEMQPGVLFDIPCANPAGRGAGALLMLSLGEEDAILAEPVMKGDREYVTRERPVEILPMDDSFNENSTETRMTIAGLPQVVVSDPAVHEKALAKPWPRFAVLRRNGSTVQPIDGEVHAGYLRLMGNSPEIQTVPGDVHMQSCWSRISYEALPAEKIAGNFQEGRWHYHDVCTGNPTRKGDFRRRPLPDGQADQVPLFFTPDWRLRYPQEDVDAHTFPARQLVEYALPREGWFTIVKSTAGSIVIELFPGRLVEIPVTLLRPEKSHFLLTGWSAAALRQGDRVYLKNPQGTSGEARAFLLCGIQYGIAAHGYAGRMVFSVLEVLENNGLVLYAGDAATGRHVHPLNNTEGYAVGQWVTVDRNNALSAITLSEIAPGDVVLADISADAATLHGIAQPHTLVLDAAEQESDWRLGLGSDTCVMPVVITKPTVNMDSGICLTYKLSCMNWHPLSENDPGTIACFCLGCRETLPETVLLLLRCGKHVFEAPADTVFEGTTADVQVELAKALHARQELLWIRRESGTWRQGFSDAETKEESPVELLAPAAGGIVCRNLSTQTIVWLPERHAARAGGATAREIWDAYDAMGKYAATGKTVLNAKRMDGCAVSLVHTRSRIAVYYNIQAIRRGGVDGGGIKVIPRVLHGGIEKGLYRYVGEMYPEGELVWFVTETEQDIGVSEPVRVVLESDPSEESVTTIEKSMIRTRLSLPGWILDSLQSAYTGEGQFDCKRFQEASAGRKKRFEVYRKATASATAIVSDAERRHLDIAKITAGMGTCEEKLLLLYGMYLLPAGKSLLQQDHTETVCSVLLEWRKSGEFFAEDADSYDLPPVLAAVGLLHGFGDMPEQNFLSLRDLCVEYVRRCAGISVYHEILTNYWLTQDRNDDLWLRLNKLFLAGAAGAAGASSRQTDKLMPREEFKGTLTQWQRERLVHTCKTILIRSALHHQLIDNAAGMNNESPLLQLSIVAYSLLKVIGAEDLHKYRSVQKLIDDWNNNVDTRSSEHWLLCSESAALCADTADDDNLRQLFTAMMQWNDMGDMRMISLLHKKTTDFEKSD